MGIRIVREKGFSQFIDLDLGKIPPAALLPQRHPQQKIGAQHLLVLFLRQFFQPLPPRVRQKGHHISVFLFRQRPFHSGQPYLDRAYFPSIFACFSIFLYFTAGFSPCKGTQIKKLNFYFKKRGNSPFAGYNLT